MLGGVSRVIDWKVGDWRIVSTQTCKGPSCSPKAVGVVAVPRKADWDYTVGPIPVTNSWS